MLSIRECVEPDDIMSTFLVMNQLRQKLKIENYLELIQSLKKTDGYYLVALFENNTCIAVVGYWIRRRLFNNGSPEVYVDDLVTDISHRSKGCGKVLFDWLKKESEKLGYRGIALDSGVQRVQAHKFYKREGMDTTAFHFYRPNSSEL